MTLYKDWLVANTNGDLLCITIESKNGKDWYLKEWVKFFGLDDKKMADMVHLGYSTMLDAAVKKGDKYEYNIAPHEFNRKDIEESLYLKSVFGKNLKKDHKVSLNLKINREQFESTISMLVPNSSFNNIKESTPFKDLVNIIKKT